MSECMLSQPRDTRKAGLPAFEGFGDPRRHYTQVPDYLLDFLLPELPGSELKILLYLIRHAFGYGRESVAVSWSRFLDGTVTREGKRLDWGAGVRRDALKEGLPSLIEQGLITKERQSSDRRGNEASLYTLRIQPSRGEEEPSRHLADHPGFLRIPNSTNVPNQLFDALLPHVTEGELKVLCYIIRRTIGMKAEDAAISYPQFARGITTEDGRVLDRGTGLSEATIKRALRGLEEKRCIVRERPDQSGTDEPNRYRLCFVEDERRGSEPAQGGGQNPHKGEVRNHISMGDQKPHKGGVRNHTHETQYLNTEKHSHEKQQHLATNISSTAADVVVALVDRGVTKVIGERLARRYPTRRILAQLDMLGYRDADNPAAMLIRAIEEDWAPPSGYETPEEREAQAREAVRIVAELETWREEQTADATERAIQPRREPMVFMPFAGSALNSRQAWATTLLSLKTTPGAEPYLKGSKLLEREGDCVVIGVTSAYAAEWLGRRIAGEAARQLSAIGGEQVGVRFVAASQHQPAAAAAKSGRENWRAEGGIPAR